MNEISFRVIDATSDLVAFCDQAKANGWVALDTEFFRERTYYAQLGLIQLGLPEQTVLFDPQSGVDAEPVWELIADEHVIKVLHSGGEDIELLYHQAGKSPQNVFDTQIAAAFVGLGESLGYAALVNVFFQIELDKSQSRTDWLARPLSKEQLIYAAADVYYLARLYPQLMAQVTEQGRLELVADECALQIAKRTRQTEPDLAWRDIGNAWQTTGNQLAVLQELAGWRLVTARKKDKPLSFILKDAALTEIARKCPQQYADLALIEGIHPKVMRQYGEVILALVKRGLARSADDIPTSMPRLDFEPGYKALFKQTKSMLRSTAEALQVEPALLGSRKQINDVFQWLWFCDETTKERLPPPDLLSGWRGKLVKEPLRALLLPRP